MTVLNRAEFNRRCSERGENPMEPFWGGFRTLMEAGKRESTDEYVVLKYRDFFSAKAIAKAQTRIEEWDREHSN